MPSTLADVWFKVTDLEIEAGSGALVRTADGTEYLDFTSGIGVVNTGHCHPAVVEAVREQAGRLLHGQMNVYRHPLAERLAARLRDITPDAIERFFFSNSGAEAVESAVKLARQATRRPNIVVFQGSFHGRTAQTMAMTTSKTIYRGGHEPLPSGVFVAPFPDPLHSGEDPRVATRRCLDELELMLLTQTAPHETAAMFIEPVLGEGGYLPAPREFLEGVASVCRRHDILLVADEIQTGFGRTGRFFACEEYGIRPDILVMAKGMASGFPISAIGASAELMAMWPQGSHGGTYGGNPMGCAAALATIEVLSDAGFLESVREKGRRLMASLTELERADAGLGDVRGMGLMIGCPFVDADRHPDPQRTKAVARHMLDEARVILMSCGPSGNVLRWIPPLVATTEQLDVAVKAFAAALEATAS